MGVLCFVSKMNTFGKALFNCNNQNCLMWASETSGICDPLEMFVEEILLFSRNNGKIVMLHTGLSSVSRSLLTNSAENNGVVNVKWKN